MWEKIIFKTLSLTCKGESFFRQLQKQILEPLTNKRIAHNGGVGRLEFHSVFISQAGIDTEVIICKKDRKAGSFEERWHLTGSPSQLVLPLLAVCESGYLSVPGDRSE